MAGNGSRTARMDVVRALADLAGRTLSDAEAAVVLHHAENLSPARANEIWTQHARAPTTVSLRDYLAMTLRFVDLGSPDQ